MWQNNRMSGRVRKAEAATKDMAKPVMQLHAGRTQACAASPATKQRIGAKCQIARLGDDARQRLGEGCDAPLSEAGRGRIAVRCIECFHGMGHGI